jgi:hypothetical protein
MNVTDLPRQILQAQSGASAVATSIQNKPSGSLS